MNEFSNERVKGYLHADGMKMVNGDGEQVILRGWGTGNWMNLEGFMIGGPSDTTRQRDEYDPPRWFDRTRTVKATVAELCGPEYAKEFWQKWLHNHLAEGDIKLMSELGCNSVRLVLNADEFLINDPSRIAFNEDGFALLDGILDACEKYGLYAILDMHAAPGGHSSVNIDSGIDNIPHLFVDEETFERGLALWEEIARRYKDRWIVGAYEILNEPLFMLKWITLRPKLIEFFDKAIERIRKIDKQHMFSIEGLYGAREISVFDHDYDPECHNWCITLHYYGMRAEMRELAPYLALAKKYNVPIWMGEGAGSPETCPQFYEMAYTYGIGWNQWCWKTAQNKNMFMKMSVVSYDLTDEWDDMQKFFFGGPKPGYEKAKRIFDQMLENMKVENCELHPEIMDPQMRRPNLTLSGAAYDHSTVPGVTFSGGWDYGNVLRYRIEDHTKLTVVPGKNLPNLIPAGIGEQLDRRELMKYTVDNDPMKQLMLNLGKDGFAVYTIRDVKKECHLTLKLAVLEDTKMSVSVDGTVLKELELKAADGVQEIDAGILPAAEAEKVRLDVYEGETGVVAIVFAY